MYKSLNFKRSLLLLVALLLPISVYAGAVGSFFNNLFKDPIENKFFLDKTVQTMTLLTVRDAPFAENQSVGVSIIENKVLVSDFGYQSIDSDLLAHKFTSDQISIYIVREGDTLSQIAEMFSVTVNTIKWGNDLSSNTLRTGQTLVILPVSGVKHTVVKGDKVTILAKKYKGDVEEILAYNDLQEGDSLTLGSIIIIPDGEVIPVPSLPTKSSNLNQSSSSLKEYDGYYMRPIVGGRKTQGIHGYNGIDIAAPLGTQILASADGEVIISRSGSWNGGYGNYLVIRHQNGTQTLYSHNSKNLVSVGDRVKQGDVIGQVGATGKATGHHLHFEIRGAKNPF